MWIECVCVWGGGGCEDLGRSKDSQVHKANRGYMTSTCNLSPNQMNPISFRVIGSKLILISLALLGEIGPEYICSESVRSKSKIDI